MSSSLRNAVKRKTHKERSQPKDRSRLGLLEKHKDYVQRARDYNRKKDTLFKLHRKAAFRNPDEFFYKMHNATTNHGVHQSTNNHSQSLSHEALQLLKTQDLAYINMKKSIDANKALKLKDSLHFLDVAGTKNKHTIFLEDEKELETFDAVTHFDTAPGLENRVYNRIRKGALEEVDISRGANLQAVKKLLKRSGAKDYQELLARVGRAKKLNNMREKLELERNLTGKGSKRKVKEADGDLPAVYKWKQQRKR